ncbi:unnamed protein product [Parnassius apollo]|uniref:(apollo) hypothetical protein n=1 Tax=Parnassius apollo TaxID=110799 RepID=A0A8S3WYS5_PARAO|nr:unnamed protein product [Parnassius apollo]
MLVTYLEASRDLCETDSVLFGAAVAACRIIGAKLPMAGRATKQSSAIPAWRKRIEDRIAKARALIGRLISFRSAGYDAETNGAHRRTEVKDCCLGEADSPIYREFKAVQPESSLQDVKKRLYKSLERPEVCGAGPGSDQANTVAFWRGL